MNTFRHNYSLVHGLKDEKIIAPRCFICKGKKRFVHITKLCENVFICDELYIDSKKNIHVAFANLLKLYSNSKGLYFNYSYWVNSFEKKTIRVYICD